MPKRMTAKLASLIKEGSKAKMKDKNANSSVARADSALWSSRTGCPISYSLLNRVWKNDPLMTFDTIMSVCDWLSIPYAINNGKVDVKE